MAIRMAVAGDASRIAALHCASWRDAYKNVLERAYLEGPIEADRRAFWSGRFAEPDPARTVFVADAPGESLVGFVCIQQDVDAEWGSLIDNLHVAPALRGEGVGAQLMRTAALSLSGGSRTTRLHLWVFEANEAGLRFYRRLGGEVVERGSSRIPAATGAAVLRVFWPDLSVLTG